MTMNCLVEVCSKSEYESKEAGERYTLDLQITDMDLKSKKKSEIEPEKLYKTNGEDKTED
jgi:hypothetical protein